MRGGGQHSTAAEQARRRAGTGASSGPGAQPAHAKWPYWTDSLTGGRLTSDTDSASRWKRQWQRQRGKITRAPARERGAEVGRERNNRDSSRAVPRQCPLRRESRAEPQLQRGLRRNAWEAWPASHQPMVEQGQQARATSRRPWSGGRVISTQLQWPRPHGPHSRTDTERGKDGNRPAGAALEGQPEPCLRPRWCALRCCRWLPYRAQASCAAAHQRRHTAYNCAAPSQQRRRSTASQQRRQWL